MIPGAVDMPALWQQQQQQLWKKKTGEDDWNNSQSWSKKVSGGSSLHFSRQDLPPQFHEDVYMRLFCLLCFTFILISNWVIGSCELPKERKGDFNLVINGRLLHFLTFSFYCSFHKLKVPQL